MRKGKPSRRLGIGRKEAPARPEIESARNRIQGLMALPSEERVSGVPDVVEAIKELPPPDAGHLLVETARKWQASALPLLETFLEDSEYAPAAAEALGFIRSESAAALLQKVDRPGAPKPLAKAARRALHRLRSQGISAEEVVPPAPGGAGLIGGRRILKAMMTPVDPKGGQFFALYVSAPLSGPEFVQVLASDVEGIKETAIAPIRKRELAEHLEEMRKVGMTLVDVPAEYVLFRVRRFEAINEISGTPLPFKYHLCRDLFHMPGPDYEQPLIYGEVDAEAIRSDPSLPKRAEELFEAGEFEGWFLPMEQIKPFALRVVEARESPLVLSEAAKDERIERALREAADELFTPEVRAGYKRRLEENAYVLLHTDRAELARIALACAMELTPDGLPSHRIPFVQAVVTRSTAFFIAQEEREPRIHEVRT